MKKFGQSRSISFGILLLAFGVLLSPLMAQSNRGIITGTVTDQSGAVIEGATVTAIHTGTNLKSQTTSGGGGKYTIPDLPVGTYNVTAEAAKFKKYVKTGIVVETGQTVRADCSLQLGQVTESIEVSAEATRVMSDTSDRGTNVTSKDILELPIIGSGEQRNPAYFMILAPGVTGRGTPGSRDGNTTVNGGMSASHEFVLDGALIGNPAEWAGEFRNIPFPQDVVAEFKVLTLLPPAEYGRTGQGITTFNLRSGTNAIHGSVYEYFRNNALDARGFFASKAAINKQNEFGATVGGPIRKDKTFFYGWYQGFRLRKGSNNTTDTVPTAAMRSGDLSNILGAQVGTDALGRPVYSNEIYDPATTRTVAAGATDPGTGIVNNSGASVILRDAFGFDSRTGLPISGQANVIPSNRIDPTAAKMFSYFPNPVRPGIGQGGIQGNWITTTASIGPDTNQWGVKLDQAFGANQKLSGEFIRSVAPVTNIGRYPNPIGEGGISQISANVFRLNWDYILRPNVINHATVGFNRNASQSFPLSGLGWPGILGYGGVPQTGNGTVWPGLNIGGLGNTYGNAGQGYDASNTYTFDDGLTWIKGKHTFKGGFQYIKMQQNDGGFGRQSGYFNFNCGTTSLPGAWYNDGCGLGSPSPGLGVGGFLLGQVSSGEAIVYSAVNGDRMGQYGMYFQDDYKFSPKLTFNLGLRYDLIRPTVSNHNQMSWMDPFAPNPGAGGLPGAMVFASDSQRTGIDTYKKAIGPRFGFAYLFNEKTVLRGGYGILYTTGGGDRSTRGSMLQGWNSDNVIGVGSTAGYAGLDPAFTFAGGWPADRFPAPPFLNSTYGLSLAPHPLYPTDNRIPQIQNATIGVQRELPGQILLDVAWVWTKGQNLVSRLNCCNVMPTNYMAAYGTNLTDPIGSAANQALPIVQAMPVDPATGNHSPFAGFEALYAPSSGGTLAQALRPFPQYTREANFQMRDFAEGVGMANYNSLQIQARKRYSYGLSFLISYTWAKTLTNADSIFSEFTGFTQDYYNTKPEKALAINDYPQNLVVSYQYELPFGPGKKWLNSGGAMGKILGGWSVAGIQQYTSGSPQMIMTGSPVGLNLGAYVGTNSFINRPNVIPGVEKKSAAVLNGTWDPNAPNEAGSRYNINAWADPAPFTLGNAPKTDGDIRNPNYYNEDISIIKRTNINERISVEFRADFLNMFNRVVFGFDAGGDQYGNVLQGNGIDSGIGSFGHILSQGNIPREIQFGLKIFY